MWKQVRILKRRTQKNMLSPRKLLYFAILYGVMVTVILWMNSRDGRNNIREVNAELNRLRGDVEILRMYKQMLLEKLRLVELHETIETKGIPEDTLFEYAIQRRRVFNGLKEIRYFVTRQLVSFYETLSSDKFDRQSLLQSINSTLDDVNDHIRSTYLFFNNMTKNDGHTVFRRKNLMKVSELILNRLYALQFPSDCSKMKYIRCVLNKACGFGCQMHHVGYCLLFAYATGRQLILESNSWYYSAYGFNSVFLPLGNCSVSFTTGTQWNGDLTPQIIDIPIIDGISPSPDFLPLNIPSNIAKALTGLHGSPYAFFIGHLLEFIMRLQPALQSIHENRKKKMGYERPLVGFHIRRTDKLQAEAASHSVSEYMHYANEFFEQYRKENPVRLFSKNIFLATDEPKVIDEIVASFPSYKFFFNRSNANVASGQRRYSHESLIGIVMDILMLSECDFIVCTFSSQVCRLAYELMQARYKTDDASWRVQSLDDVYYYGGQITHDERALFAHMAKNNDEISFEVGDIIGLAGNHWNGYSKGKNKRTHQIGLFPSYKAEEVFPVFDLLD